MGANVYPPGFNNFQLAERPPHSWFLLCDALAVDLFLWFCVAQHSARDVFVFQHCSKRWMSGRTQAPKNTKRSRIINNLRNYPRLPDVGQNKCCRGLKASKNVKKVWDRSDQQSGGWQFVLYPPGVFALIAVVENEYRL
jgi:hypothetical protein